MLRPYLELVRPPNVATALADVLAGFAVAGLAGFPALPRLALASACLYAGGVALNDYFDRAIDRVERPERPLPSGRVPPRHAAWLGGSLLALGTLLSASVSLTAALVGGGIALSVLLYDAVTKHHRVAGPLNMGLCRGLNLLLGMTAASGTVSAYWPLGLIALTYVAGVTTLSRGEVAGGQRPAGLAAIGLIGASLSGLAGVAVLPGRHTWVGLSFTAVVAWRVFPPFVAAWRAPSPGAIRRAVGRGVLSLVFLDAALAGAFAGLGYSAGLLVAALAAGWLARSFEVT